MSTLVYMKILEQSPAGYDRWMRFLTMGRIDRIKMEIADKCIKHGDRVLEIGCGTGSLARLMSQTGAEVTAIDISEKMLVEARKNAPEVTFFHLTALEIDQLAENRLNRIVATLSFSELTEDELNRVLELAAKLLQPNGLLIVADEVRAATSWQRFVAAAIRWPIAIITFLVTQQTTHVLKNFEARLSANKFELVLRREYLLGTMALFVGKRQHALK